LFAAAVIAVWPKTGVPTDPAFADKQSLIGQQPFCNYTVWETSSDKLVEVIRIPGPRRTGPEEQALINWAFFKYPAAPGRKYLMMVHCWDGQTGTNVELVKW
jgi:hypothetical protein